MNLRYVRPDDYSIIITNLDDWWGGRKVSPMLPRLFFEHFRNTSFILEEGSKIVGFLIGFLSQSQPEEAYIHFVGVHPDYRGRGFGRLLYEQFFTTVRGHQRHIVRCVTSPINLTSIAYHAAMGFSIEPGSAESAGVAHDPNHDGPGEPRVCFLRHV